MKMNYFNQLPPELNCFIFKYLNFDELVKIRSVNKRFKSIIESIKFSDLIVNSSKNYWFHSNESMKRNHRSFNVNYLPLYLSILKLDKNLKRLRIEYSFEIINLSYLNDFKQLEHLELEVLFKKELELGLPNLKVLSLDSTYNILKVEAPELYALKKSFKWYKDAEFVFPNSVKYMSRPYQNSSKCNKFSEIEYFEYEIHHESDDRDILSKFKHLKVLDCKFHNDYHRFFKIEDFYVVLMEQLDRILTSKFALKRNDLIIYFQGVELSKKSLKEMKQFDISDLSNEFFKLQIKSYDNLCRNMTNITCGLF